MKISLEELFKYHPPQTEERREAHESINKAAKDFALVIQENVKDEESKRMALYAVQFARMMSNQGITIDELVL